jgi:hypothetical protein
VHIFCLRFCYGSSSIHMGFWFSCSIYLSLIRCCLIVFLRSSQYKKSPGLFSLQIWSVSLPSSDHFCYMHFTAFLLNEVSLGDSGGFDPHWVIACRVTAWWCAAADYHHIGALQISAERKLGCQYMTAYLGCGNA